MKGHIKNVLMVNKTPPYDKEYQGKWRNNVLQM